MNKIIIVLPGQTLPDIAVEHGGDLSAWPVIASLNSLRMTDTIEAGQSLLIPLPINKVVSDEMAKKGYQPATSDALLEGIDYWAVLYEFIVS